jgi:hypothetical protein
MFKLSFIRNKISSKLEKEAAVGPHEPEGASRGRGRGRGGRGRGRGEDGREWSLKKYDFEAPDMEATLREHKPNFVKAPRRVFEKHGGYYSDEEEEKRQAAGEEEAAGGVAKKESAGEAVRSEERKKEDDGFRRVTREEWNTMSKREKKIYLRERKRHKMRQMVYIKDDSDNEQLTSSGALGSVALLSVIC